ncbi:alpha/beta fold hydrolase [Consotaella aegiceratis]|uniref:alpha/beta fold hydrolase n=1 Tax=Consotaella aegiceratis TaxID=3097961 RepID=UPI002F3ED86C
MTVSSGAPRAEDLRAAEARIAALPERRHFEYSGGVLSYRQAGAGPTIVFLHGLLGSSSSWIRQMEALSGRFRVVAWDAPGYGQSSLVASDIIAYADALAALLRHLGGEDVTVVGHSMGGAVATAAAAVLPAVRLDRLVLSCTHAGYAAAPGTPPTEKLTQRIANLKSAGPEAYGLTRAQAMVAPETSPSVVALAACIAAETHPDGLFNATRALQFANCRPFYERIAVPTLALFAERDPVVRPELSAELRRLTPFARHVDLPDVGHAPYLEAPEAYSHHIQLFASMNRAWE